MTMDVPISALSEAEHRQQLHRALVASTVGTTIEWYDFLLYGQVSALVFGPLFFPQSSPLVGVLQAFGIFFIGFVGRPIGAAIFGHWGDRIGRKATLIATLLVSGILAGVRHRDGGRRSRPDLREHRHLGPGSADGHSIDPGDRRRRRVGRLGIAGDGMGANHQASRRGRYAESDLDLRTQGHREPFIEHHPEGVLREPITTMPKNDGGGIVSGSNRASLNFARSNITGGHSALRNR